MIFANIQSITIPRLKHLVTVLKRVPRAKFKMDTWYSDHYFKRKRRVTVPDSFVDVDCHTAACALGWASLDKQFRKEGLVMSFGTPEYNDNCGVYAAVDFFNIEAEEAKKLFMPSTFYPAFWITPGRVIRRVKKLIRRYGGAI